METLGSVRRARHSKVLELEDALKHKKRHLSDHIEMEKRYGFRKMMLESCCNMFEGEVV